MTNIKYDVISEYESEYCHATLPSHGMIQIEGKTFHRGNKLKGFKAFTFSSLKAAKAMLPDEFESFIIEFEGKNGAERMWFSKRQFELGIVSRLDLWKACYDKYPVSIYRNKK
jgi:hypothetical protein